MQLPGSKDLRATSDIQNHKYIDFFKKIYKQEKKTHEQNTITVISLGAELRGGTEQIV